MQKTPKSRVLDMTDGRPFRLLLAFALPLFIGNLLQQFYNLADTAIAGNVLGDEALAQIGATTALYSLITNFAFGMNNGLALTVSRYFGASDEEKMRQATCWMTILSMLSAAVLTVGFLSFRTPILRLMQIPAKEWEGAMAYLTVILAGIPLTMAYNLESGLLQAVGNTVTPLCFLLFSSILNIGLDFLFMGPFGFGVRGAAEATVLSQGVCVIIGFWYIFRNYPSLRFGRRECHVSSAFVRNMLVTGLGMAFMNALYSLGSVVLQSSINALGNVYIAAQVGGRRLAELFYIPGVAISTAVATYSSQNYGARKRRRIVSGIKAALILYGIWWLLDLLFVFTVAPAAIRLITGSENAAVIENGWLYLRVSAPLMPTMAVLIMIRNALQGIGRPALPVFCSALELIGKVIFAVWIVPVWGYPAVCICEPVTWIICMICIVIGTWIFDRKEFQDVQGEAA